MTAELLFTTCSCITGIQGQFLKQAGD